MNYKSYAVLGLGRYGMAVADELMERGADVLAVDHNERIINENAHKYTQAVIADLTDVDAIRQLSLGTMDAVIVAMAQNLEASIMCVMIAKESGVHKVIAKAENRRKGDILKKIGADQIVIPEKESGRREAFRLMSRDLIQFFDLTSDLVIAEIEPHKEWCGKTLRDLALRNEYGLNVIATRKKDKVVLVDNGNAVINKGEPMLIVLSKEDLDKLER